MIPRTCWLRCQGSPEPRDVRAALSSTKDGALAGRNER
jgi:hypothetical protein